MALVKEILAGQILSLMNDLYTRTDDPEKAQKDFADSLAAYIEQFIKSATVTSSVTTTGVCPSGAVASTGSAISTSIS